MSEPPAKYETENKYGELRFVRLKDTFEDLVGYVIAEDSHLKISFPLRVEVETIFDEGRQILSLYEFLPQSIIDLKEIKIHVNDVMFIAPVKWDFYNQYEHVKNFFYEAQVKQNNEKKISSKNKKAKLEENDFQENVISILEALSKKDKPIH